MRGGGEAAGSKQFYLISQVSFQIASKKCREELKSECKCVHARVRVYMCDRERLEVEREKYHPPEKAGKAQSRDWEIMEETDRAEEWKGMYVREGKNCLRRNRGTRLEEERDKHKNWEQNMQISLNLISSQCCRSTKVSMRERSDSLRPGGERTLRQSSGYSPAGCHRCHSRALPTCLHQEVPPA